jgi:hypothetical protein
MSVAKRTVNYEQSTLQRGKPAVIEMTSCELSALFAMQSVMTDSADRMRCARWLTERDIMDAGRRWMRTA